MHAEIGGDSRSANRWGLLGLAGVTATLVVAMPAMAMPVLFAEIAEELGLSLVQVGAIWGIASLAGLFASLAGGALGDRYGTGRTLAVACLAVGLTGALRGASNSLATMACTVFLSGLVVAAIPQNLHKVCGVWFSGRRLGLANGVIAAGMALGFMTGSMLSAAVLSPWLGSWRNVLFFYGGIAVVMSLPWAFARTAPQEPTRRAGEGGSPSIRLALSHVTRVRDVWFLGFALLGVGGCVQGFLGYLPLYLRGIGWAATRADAALAAFHAISLAAVFPLALLCSRLRLRRSFLAAATVLIVVGVGLLSIVDGTLVWLGVLMAGVVRDGYMAILITTVTEARGVGAIYAGTAIGLTMTFSRLGGLIAPPLGNSLAAWNPHLPFVLWAAMACVGLVALALIRGGRETVRFKESA